MSSENTKAAREVEVFLRFLAESKLPIEPSSVEKRPPPEPDILCHHKVEGAVAFELVEICDSTLAEFMSTVTEGGVTYIRTSDPSSGIVRRKLRRTYNTEAPIELLCYTAGRVITPDDVIVPTIKPWFSGRRHAFRRAWLLGESGVQVVWTAG